MFSIMCLRHREFGSTQLQTVTLTGVETAFTKHQENTEHKGVKAHFRVDDSGILTLDKVVNLALPSTSPQFDKCMYIGMRRLASC